MKIFYFSDSNFLDMKINFENSFKDDFEQHFYLIDNIHIDHNKPGSGLYIWKYKTRIILDAIKTYPNEVIIVSDIDIVFYKSVLDIIEECMVDTDICFQKEHTCHGINIGFMSILCNKTTLSFWNTVYKIICDSHRWDQEIVNTIMYKYNFPIKWKLFPQAIWSWSQSNITKDIVLHHANCASSKEEKYEQMRYVFDFVNG